MLDSGIVHIGVCPQRSATPNEAPIAPSDLRELIQDYLFYEHPPHVALSNSRAVVDPPLRTTVID
jgi:hypothetical protein